MPSLVGLELDSGEILLRFTRTAAETGGALHEQEARYVPRSKPPPYHCHPRQEEVFRIVEGGLRFHVDGADRDVAAGDELRVPAGVYHRAHNPGDVPAIVIWQTRPALRTADLFRAMYGASRARGRPGLTEAAAILREYRDEVRLARPPAIVQTIVFGCLAPLGRRRMRSRLA